MIIEKIESRQFGGVHFSSREGETIQFSNGLNIVLGENESGKSTMADLIFHLFFQATKLDGKKDSDFKEKYFPKKVDGLDGDLIDGVIKFETDKGHLELRKNWKKEGLGTNELIMPDGTLISDANKINEILNEELQFGKGIYGELIFASQKRQQVALESILTDLRNKSGEKYKGLRNTKNDFTELITRAALETGGVSLNEIEAKLGNIINKYGKDWNLENELPRKGDSYGIQNKWKSATTAAADKGEKAIILRTYYDLEELIQEKENIEERERNYAECLEKRNDIETEKKEKEDKRERFLKIRRTLDKQNSLSYRKKELEDMQKARDKWAEIPVNLNKAKILSKNLEDAKIHELFLKVEKPHDEFVRKNKELESLTPISSEDLETLDGEIRRKDKFEGQLAGMKVAAKIQKLSSNDVKVRTIASDKELVADGEEYQITEAVDILIEGIADIQLMPQGVDIHQLKMDIENATGSIQEILSKYDVCSESELKEKKSHYDNLSNDVERARDKIDKLLGDDITWDEINKKNSEVPGQIETTEEIKSKVKELCGLKPLDLFIEKLNEDLSDLEQKYESYENLDRLICNQDKEIGNITSELSEIDEIPEEFQGISDLDEFYKHLSNDIDKLVESLSRQDRELGAANDKRGDKSPEEYDEEISNKKAELETKINECKRWLDIQTVFLKTKEEVSGNPMKDIGEKFQEYLKDISYGEVSLTSIDENMTTSIKSGNRSLTYDILSDGTKDTITLAFRLAMLEHLYPDGGGLAVFDDPFTDMDPRRVEQSCKLIQKFAEKNQVIFITCDEKYKNLMPNGNIIQVSK